MTATMVFVQAAPDAGEREALGIDRVLSRGAARDTLTWIARHTQVDQAIIADHLRDVAVYLTRAVQKNLLAGPIGSTHERNG